MSEPELPGIPPPPPQPSPPWYKRLFAHWKWPGWGAIGLGSLPLPLRVFRLGEDIDFAVTLLRSIGSELGTIAAIVASPFFAVGLIAYGVAHLLLVGEPKQAFRSHAWVYAGWVIFGLCFTAIVFTAGWGAIQVYVHQQITQAQQPTQTQFWYLTDKQKYDLGNALDEIPQDQRFSVLLQIVFGNAQATTFSNDLGEVFHEHGWVIRGSQDMQLRADLLGINFVLAMDFPRKDKDSPPHAAELAKIFDKAGIKYSFGLQQTFDNNSLILAIGSRPPNW
jgi:hypothetical protein